MTRRSSRYHPRRRLSLRGSWPPSVARGGDIDVVSMICFQLTTNSRCWWRSGSDSRGVLKKRCSRWRFGGRVPTISVICCCMAGSKITSPLIAKVGGVRQSARIAPTQRVVSSLGRIGWFPARETDWIWTEVPAILSSIPTMRVRRRERFRVTNVSGRRQVHRKLATAGECVFELVDCEAGPRFGGIGGEEIANECRVNRFLSDPPSAFLRVAS